MAFARKSFFSKTEKEAISDLYSSDILREKVPGVAETEDAVQHYRSLMREMHALGEFSKKYGEMRRVAMMTVGDMVLCEELHKTGCSCGQPVFGVGGHKEWFFSYLDLPGVKEKHDLRYETVCK